ncbi:glycosyltransferase [Paenibacillus polymyxa]|uniref:CgeB family protein n=1 Tax=Paenibacillus polymyxa TaxID=1406 RepID=UPI001BE9F8B1|nr:glycosyltransferase [Paenibacillus polymyxa]MBT2282952.1 glycosyltransferase [Paenibacillus polymyxa]
MNVALVLHELAYNSFFHGEVWGENIDALGIQSAFKDMFPSNICQLYTSNILMHLKTEGLLDQLKIDLAIHFYWPTVLIEGAKNVLFFQQFYDDGSIFQEASKHFGMFDLVMTNAAKITDENPEILYFPLAVDVKEFEQASVNQVKSEAVFIGNTKMRSDDVYKRFLLPATALDLHIYGKGWGDEKYRNYLPYYKGIIPINEMPAVYKSTKLILCIHNEDYINKYGLVTNRIFHALAAGKMLISDHHPKLMELFSEGEGVVYTRGYDHLRETMEYLLQNDHDREKIAMQGRIKLLKEHTWKHRIEMLLAKLAEKKDGL